MFRRSFLLRRLLLGLAFWALLSSAFAHLAWAEEKACGATAHEAIAQAEAALAPGSKPNEHLALVCLLRALKALEGASPISRDSQGSHLAVPLRTGGPGLLIEQPVKP